MTALTRISFAGHGVLELAIGLVTLVAPFALGFTPAGIVLGVVAGAFAVALALTTFDQPDTEHRGVLPIGSHYGLDHIFAVSVLLAGIVLAVGSDIAGALYFGALGLTQVALSLVTRYTLPA
jgi:hypothetical protein